MAAPSSAGRGSTNSSFGTVAAPARAQTASDDQNAREPRNRGMLGRGAGAGGAAPSPGAPLIRATTASERPIAAPVAIHGEVSSDAADRPEVARPPRCATARNGAATPRASV